MTCNNNYTFKTAQCLVGKGNLISPLWLCILKEQETGIRYFTLTLSINRIQQKPVYKYVIWKGTIHSSTNRRNVQYTLLIKKEVLVRTNRLLFWWPSKWHTNKQASSRGLKASVNNFFSKCLHEMQDSKVFQVTGKHRSTGRT